MWSTELRKFGLRKSSWTKRSWHFTVTERLVSLTTAVWLTDHRDVTEYLHPSAQALLYRRPWHCTTQLSGPPCDIRVFHSLPSPGFPRYPFIDQSVWEDEHLLRCIKVNHLYFPLVKNKYLTFPVVFLIQTLWNSSKTLWSSYLFSAINTVLSANRHATTAQPIHF